MSGRLACLAAMLRMLFLTTWYSAPWARSWVRTAVAFSTVTPVKLASSR
jgi:hypothetical protein